MHNFYDEEENKSYVIDGAKVLLTLSDPRKFFASKGTPQEEKKSCKTQ